MKKRSDSSHVETEIFKAAAGGITPPNSVSLTKRELVFWRDITETRAEWSKVDLLHAANLSRCFASIEENQKLLRKEGDVLTNERGTRVMNPRFTILEQLSRRAASLSTKIHVHAVATLGEAKLGKGKNGKKRQALDALSQTEDDDLISRPIQ